MERDCDEEIKKSKNNWKQNIVLNDENARRRSFAKSDLDELENSD